MAEISTCVTCGVSAVKGKAKLLPCLHTVCFTCVNKGEKQDSSTRRIQCNICQKSHLVNEVIENLFIPEPDDDDIKIYICTSCDDNQAASHYCGTCPEWLCQVCASAHKRVKITKDHNTITVEEAIKSDANSHVRKPKLKCPNHNTENLELYCRTCGVLTCKECQISDHKQHDYWLTSVLKEGGKALIRALITMLERKLLSLEESQKQLSSLCDELFRQKQETETQMTGTTQNVSLWVLDCYKVLMENLSDICHSAAHELTKDRQLVYNSEIRTSNCLRLLQEALASHDDCAILYTKAVLMKNIQAVLEEANPEVGEDLFLDVAYVNTSQSLLGSIDKLGYLEIDGHTFPEGMDEIQDQPEKIGSDSSPIVIPTSPLEKQNDPSIEIQYSPNQPKRPRMDSSKTTSPASSPLQSSHLNNNQAISIERTPSPLKNTNCQKEHSTEKMPSPPTNTKPQQELATERALSPETNSRAQQEEAPQQKKKVPRSRRPRNNNLQCGTLQFQQQHVVPQQPQQNPISDIPFQVSQPRIDGQQTPRPSIPDSNLLNVQALQANLQQRLQHHELQQLLRQRLQFLSNQRLPNQQSTEFPQLQQRQVQAVSYQQFANQASAQNPQLRQRLEQGQQTKVQQALPSGVSGQVSFQLQVPNQHPLRQVQAPTPQGPPQHGNLISHPRSANNANESQQARLHQQNNSSCLPPIQSLFQRQPNPSQLHQQQYLGGQTISTIGLQNVGSPVPAENVMAVNQHTIYRQENPGQARLVGQQLTQHLNTQNQPCTVIGPTIPEIHSLQQFNLKPPPNWSNPVNYCNPGGETGPRPSS